MTSGETAKFQGGSKTLVDQVAIMVRLSEFAIIIHSVAPKVTPGLVSKRLPQ